MGFGIKAHNASRAASYEDCVAHFEKPANLSRMGWGKAKRPLDGIRKTHMRIEEGEGYYDVILYRTAMARYYKPDGNKREVWYNVHDSMSSKQFQYHILRLDAAAFTQRNLDGVEVLVGMNPAQVGQFPVRLKYIDGKLDTSNSVDAPAKLKSTTSDERKAARKAFKKWLRPYEAMSKIMERGASYTNFRDIERHYMTNELFDPTGLAEYIQRNGISAAVDEVYPLGDVEHYNESFKVVV